MARKKNSLNSEGGGCGYFAKGVLGGGGVEIQVQKFGDEGEHTDENGR
jgi:hypothetical protein